jgi:hypothetical protein
MVVVSTGDLVSPLYDRKLKANNYLSSIDRNEAAICIAHKEEVATVEADDNVSITDAPSRRLWKSVQNVFDIELPSPIYL